MAIQEFQLNDPFELTNGGWDLVDLTHASSVTNFHFFVFRIKKVQSLFFTNLELLLVTIFDDIKY